MELMDGNELRETYALLLTNLYQTIFLQNYICVLSSHSNIFFLLLKILEFCKY